MNKKTLNQLQAKAKSIAKTRDKLREQVSDFEDILQSSQEGLEYLNSALGDFESAIDALSQYV